MNSRYPRLSPADHMMLQTETAAAPTHIGGICILEAAPLRDQSGAVDLQRITSQLAARAATVPELHRIVRQVPPLCGRPLWVDDPAFTIENHVHSAVVPAPGDEPALLDTAELLLRRRMDRARPLWELWLLTGMTGDRCALLIKLHHALADGLAAVRLVASLLDSTHDPASPVTNRGSPAAQPIASAAFLFADNVRAHAQALAVPLRHPVRSLRALTPSLAYSISELRHWKSAPRSSLNAVVQPGRRLRSLQVDLETARAIAHAHGGTVNDVVLAVVAGAIAELLHARGEHALQGDVIAAIGVNVRDASSAAEGGNVVAALRVRLPIGAMDARRRLAIIAGRTRTAKAEQHISRRSSNVVLGIVGCLASAGVPFAEHQRMVNVFVSNVRGPASPLYAFGAKVEEVIPVVGLFGNETISFTALSYCGRLNLVSVADRAAVPDVDMVVAGMRRTWEQLAACDAAAPRHLHADVAPEPLLGVAGGDVGADRCRVSGSRGRT